MKPYSIRPHVFADVGCCPGHDWPRTKRWSGSYSSAAHFKASSKMNKRAKRIRRHTDKANLKNEID